MVRDQIKCHIITRARTISSSIPFPVPEHTGTFHFLLVRLGSCDRVLAKKFRTEGYKPLSVLPCKNIFSNIPAFASPSTVSSSHQFKFPASQNGRSLCSLEESLWGHWPGLPWTWGRNNPTCESLRSLLQYPVGAGTEIGTTSSNKSYSQTVTTTLNKYHWLSSSTAGRKEANTKKMERQKFR